ncbi:MAG: MBL fold metallo-hydrolase [Rhodospirillaceae bacterium]|nr:MBL fold metallo-hydrolase [Rhodospirillaceae bacterium]
MKQFHWLSRAAVVSLALSCAPVSAAENTKVSNAAIEARGLTLADFPRWKAVAPNIYAYEGFHPSKVMNTVSLIVVTNDGVVLVDAMGDPDQGQKLVENIKKLTPQPVKYLIVGSDHGDHMGGNGPLKAAWPGMTVISTPASQKAMEKNAAPPTELVTDKRTLNVGGTEIQILNLGRAHTGGDLVVYLPQSKIMFMSEVYLRGVFPAMRSAYPSEWVETIKKAQAMNANLYIAGHGWVDDAATMKAGLEDSRKALEAVIKEAKRLHAAKVPCVAAPAAAAGAPPPPPCEAVTKANWGPANDLALKDSQAQIAVLKVYQEADGKLP